MSAYPPTGEPPTIRTNNGFVEAVGDQAPEETVRAGPPLTAAQIAEAFGPDAVLDTDPA